ncbi:MAG TPA: hypothetical protein VFR27_02185 [Mycobacterium sp.]|nr:hypothetical protein [Mycobacterium sp.]
MNGVHPDLGELGPELRKLAQAILDGIDPAVRAAAMLASSGNPGRCQQVWCPLCALAAVAAGEEHPLLTVIAEHSVALFAVIRAILVETGETPGPDGPPGGGAADGDGAATKGGYQHIPVTIED